ncbi:cellulose synthase-like protein G3 [Olea europaea var. sylvestris]|uniref:cellulose synthase-like protein G3 n=1 Tax=Olea europaea var. sylvestris TaxID=158386 RepID=UPI000C1D5968|nr:cellulose synthase-like protein G3 [Olea europaea var. sylvestris]
MSSATTNPRLHSIRRQHRRLVNRVFAAAYTAVILALFYYHALTLLQSTTFKSFCITFTSFVSDIILAYMWSTTQSFRMNPVTRQEYPENLEKFLDRKDFPAMDIFICTADPYKEPPINVVNTALSVMAYDYPTEKLSVYVSDDGGSELTLFAFMEAAEFARIWLPFCKENNIIERCPDAYFSSNYAQNPKILEIKKKYDSMKARVESVVEKGKVRDEYISNEKQHQVLSQYWTKDFTRQNHPSVIQVLLDANDDKDVTGNSMPNLVYVSREKSKATPHHFKAGALNALLRVSSIMTNAPIVLTLDCDMYSNDPSTLQRVLCYISDKSIRPNLGYIQIPQLYHGLNKTDIYASEHKRLYQINPPGMDGLDGPSYVGTGCFFRRLAFFGGPSSPVEPEFPEIGPNYIVNKPITDQEILDQAHQVSGCNYENRTSWGSKIGFLYGSLSEDLYTGYRLQCQGWKSIFCDPNRPAFLGDVPISLHDVLNQNKRWAVGLLEVGFSKYSPLTFGIQTMGILMGQAYAHYAFWPIWSVPITVYAFLPSLTLLNGIPIFPKVSDPWFLAYIFLFIGAYVQDCLDFLLAKGTFQRWWSDQRFWLIRGLSSYLFGSIEFITKRLNISTHGFNVTSKVMDDDQSKRYDQGIFQFGVESPMFVPLSMAAILNLMAFFYGGIVQIFKERNLDGFFVQVFIAGFGVLNCLPIYEAMFLRNDKGRMPTRITFISTLLVGGLCIVASFVLKI